MGMGEMILRDFSVDRAILPLRLMGKEEPIVLNSKKKVIDAYCHQKKKAQTIIQDF